MEKCRAWELWSALVEYCSAQGPRACGPPARAAWVVAGRLGRHRAGLPKRGARGYGPRAKGPGPGGLDAIAGARLPTDGPCVRGPGGSPSHSADNRPGRCRGPVRPRGWGIAKPQCRQPSTTCSYKLPGTAKWAGFGPFSLCRRAEGCPVGVRFGPGPKNGPPQVILLRVCTERMDQSRAI